MVYKRVKYIVQGIVAEVDEEGNIVGEQQTQQTAVYTHDQMLEFLEKFDRDIEIANLEASKNGVVAVEEE
jgi:hypothetical protein